jgi:hypothetical protein
MRSGREAVKRERLGWRTNISAGRRQDDYLGRFPVDLQEDLQQQAVYQSLIQHDLFAALTRVFYPPQQRCHTQCLPCTAAKLDKLPIH